MVLGLHTWRYNYRYLIYDLDVSILIMTGALKVISLMISYSDGTMNDEDIIKYVNNISKKNTIL